ncbi:MAG: hypothetical protein FJ276_21685 [Planctomycetes bacterium]|nr:hypothetical protein [Planctomycetota bacterium]
MLNLQRLRHRAGRRRDDTQGHFSLLPPQQHVRQIALRLTRAGLDQQIAWQWRYQRSQMVAVRPPLSTKTKTSSSDIAGTPF